MYDLYLIEEYYKKYIKNLNYWIPEDIFVVNLEILYHFDLLHFQYPSTQHSTITTHFHVVESSEKITLLNDEFIVWIIPDRLEPVPKTCVIIALNQDEPKLELAFMASGVYNTSKLVLRLLEKFLIEIQETEKMLIKFKN